MNKKYTYILIVLIIALGVLIINQTLFSSKTVSTVSTVSTVKTDEVIVSDYKNASYNIEGQNVHLVNGYAETANPESASKTITRYFGNDLVTDLNNDGRNDVVFLVTQQTGGTGTFYYVVSALNTDKGYVGSDGYFLGDRIAPQTIENSQNPKQKNVIVINYAVRGVNDPMTAEPSVGKSIYLKLDTNTMQWGIVAPNFEGESK